MNTLHTGGAKGGDKYWENLAKEKQHRIKEYHFDGHKHTRTEMFLENQLIESEVIELLPNEKTLCQSSLETASKHMNSELPSQKQRKHLLERDWIMVHRSKASSLYMTGYFQEESRLGIQGGTGWIAEIFVDEYLRHHDIENKKGKLSFSLKPLPVYFKSIDKNAQFHGWYQLCLNGLNHLKWERVEQIPEPMGNWVGVGSREVSE